jgi:DNA-binding beta-propeller fold protein YncE
MPKLRALAPPARLFVLVVLGVAACSKISFPSGAAGQWPTRPVPSFAAQARFAITDNMSDQLSFVTPSATAPALLGAEPVGDNPVELEGPHHIAASPDGRYLYVNLSNYVPGSGSGPHGSHGTGTVPGSLLKLDARTGAELGETPVDRSPGDVILSADGKTAYVSHYDLLRVQAQVSTNAAPETGYSDIAIIDTDSMRRLSMIPVCPTAHGEGLSADGKVLYTVCALSDEIAVLDVSDGTHPKVLAKMPVGPNPGLVLSPNYLPYALTVSPADGRVWISDNKGDLRVFDPAKMAMTDISVPLGDVVMFSTFTKDGSTLYVARQNAGDRVSIVDPVTATERTSPVLMPRSACLNAHAVQLSPDQGTLVVVCEGDHTPNVPGSVAYIATDSGALVGSVGVGVFADGAAWLPAAP